MSENKSARKNFKKWRSRNASDTPKSSSAKDKTNKPFVLSLADKASWSRWKDAMATQAKYEFGMLGQMCDHDKYPVLPAIDADGYDMSSDNERLNKMNTKLYFAACQNREKSIQLMKLDHPKLYSFIKLHLSHDSLAAVMMSEHFNVDKDINDPLKLWLAVKATQRPGSDAVDKSNRRVDTMNALHSCKQLAEEPIHVFYER